MDKQRTFYTHIQHSPSGVHQNNNRPHEIFEKETKKVYSYLQSQKHTFVYVSIERKKKLLDDYYTYLLEHIHFLSSSFSSASYLFIDEMGHMFFNLPASASGPLTTCLWPHAQFDNRFTAIWG